jgi:hypothetical protein
MFLSFFKFRPPKLIRAVWFSSPYSTSFRIMMSLIMYIFEIPIRARWARLAYFCRPGLPLHSHITSIYFQVNMVKLSFNNSETAFWFTPTCVANSSVPHNALHLGLVRGVGQSHNQVSEALLVWDNFHHLLDSTLYDPLSTVIIFDPKFHQRPILLHIILLLVWLLIIIIMQQNSPLLTRILDNRDRLQTKPKNRQGRASYILRYWRRISNDMGYFVSAKYIFPPIMKVWEATNFVCLRVFFLLLICLKQIRSI